jgi:hypothetical protein
VLIAVSRILIWVNSGNGGFAGTIDNANMLEQLNLGFAVAGYEYDLLPPRAILNCEC